jgi:GTP pyrophosphokinase
MHDIADRGVAAHWQYKQGYGTTEGKQYRWLRQLIEILDQASDPEEFLEHTRLEMYQDQVFCFTQRGDLISLPQGATPVDFGYQVHSEIGDTCVGAKINGRMMPLRTQLRNGDQVDVLTSKAQTPSPTWERFVVTGKARAHIRRFVRLQEREEYIKLGKSILKRLFEDEEFKLTDKALAGVTNRFKVNDPDDLYSQVGAGHLNARDILEAVYPSAKKNRAKAATDDNVTILSQARRKKQSDAPGISIKGLIPGMAMHFAGCCHALPGDRIIGIITTGKGVTIHTIDCDTLRNFQDAPERWLDLSWELEKEGESHVGRVFITVLNSPGSLGDLSTVIARLEGNISNLKIVTRSNDFFDILLDIEVKDLRHLTDIIAALRAEPSVNTVERARG